MKKSTAYKTVFILAGFVLGILVGGYGGLVLGGTFLGSFDIYENFGIEGYELTTYIGSIIGAITSLFIALKIIKKNNNKNT